MTSCALFGSIGEITAVVLDDMITRWCARVAARKAVTVANGDSAWCANCASIAVAVIR